MARPEQIVADLRRRPSWAFGVIAILYSILAVCYSLRIAPGNTPDEAAHVEYVTTLLQRRRLPVWNWPAEPNSYVAFHPPLYYFTGAQLVRSLFALPLKYRFLALRWLSGLFHLAALVFLWRMAAKIIPADEKPWAPVLLMAGLPMFIFIGAAVTNDSAADMAGAALLWFSTGPALTRSSVRGAALGLLIGVAMLCKSTLLPIAALSLLWLWLAKTPDWRRAARDCAGAIFAALLISGWFYWRNWRLYGDPYGFSRSNAYDANRFALSQLGSWLWLYFQSFWGRFGQMTQPMPQWAFGLAAAISSLSVAGWAARGRRLIGKPGRGFLAAALLIMWAQSFYFGFFLSSQPQARYAFPALAAWAVLFWDGLSVWPFAAPWAAAALALIQLAAWKSL